MRRGYPHQHCHSMMDGKLFRRGKAENDYREHFSFSMRHKANGDAYLSFIMPSGIIMGFFGPGHGRRNDGYHVRNMKIHDNLQLADRVASRRWGPGPWHTNTDQGFEESDYLNKGYPREGATDGELDYNYSCDTNRVAGEWQFSNLLQQYQFVDTRKKMKPTEQSCTLFTYGAVILHNWHMCCYGGQCTAYFKLKPPPLQKYFQVGRSKNHGNCVHCQSCCWLDA